MRIPLLLLAGSLSLVACGPGPAVVYVPTPAPVAEAPDPQPEPLPPVAITIVREEDSRLLVSTNQPAHLAVFEIVPNRGVTLVYPTSPRMRHMTHSGSSWLPVIQSDRDAELFTRGARVSRSRPQVRHLYAIASDRPLRMSTASFADDYLRESLSTRAYRGTDPYLTIDELTRLFVPTQMEDDWGEDLYTVDIARTGMIIRVAKVYCPDGTILYVRDDLAASASCPSRGRGAGAVGSIGAIVPPPDSIVASNGRRISRRPDTADRGPMYRVRRPAQGSGNEGTGNGGTTVGNGNGRNGNSGVGNGNGGGATGNRGNAGQSASSGRANGKPDSVSAPSRRGTVWQRGAQQAGKPAEPEKPEPKPEPKPEQPSERRPDGTPEQQKPEKPEPKPEQPSERRPDETPAEQKPEAKPAEQKPAARRGALWQRGQAPQPSDSTDKGKPAKP